MILMNNIEIGKVHTVNGHKYRDVELIDEATGFPIAIDNQVLTIHCGWTSDHICNRACDCDCRNAQNLYDEIGIEY